MKKKLALPWVSCKICPQTECDDLIANDLDEVTVRCSHATCLQHQIMCTKVKLLFQDTLQGKNCLQDEYNALNMH